MPTMLRTLTFALAGVLLLATGPARAENPEVFTDHRTGLAIKGYDPVAYFTEGEPRKGDPAHAYEWNGATWYFASAAHRDAFAENPKKYAPEFGGYCAYAITKGNAVPADPRVWSVVDGQLYLNLSPNVRKVWQEDLRDNIAMGHRNWPEALEQEGRTKFDPAGAGDR